MIKPRQLRKGDRIAIVSPSGGAALAFPHVLKAGITYLEDELGLRIREYPTVRMTRQELYDHPELRAKDINEAFRDPEIAGIISSIGGNDSVRILEHLDLETIRGNPKVIMGYSDSTSFLAYLNSLGLVTYYGSSVMAGFAYLRNFSDGREEYERTLFGREPYSLKAFQNWGERYASWMDPTKAGLLEAIYPEEKGHHWLNKGPRETGKLWGGCLEILEMMNGTFAWPAKDFWEGRILFIETSEEKPTPDHVGYVLRNFGLQGILGRIHGLLVGRPKDYSLEEKNQLDETLRRIVVDEFGRSDLSIVSNLDIGHTDPRHILPYGIDLEIDSHDETLSFTEELFTN